MFQITSLLSEDAFDLLQVVDVVPGKHAHDVLNRFLATLGMHSVMLPLLGRQGFEQCKIGFPKHAELIERLARIALVIMPAAHPGILIEGRNRSSRRTQNQPHTETADDFRVREVRENLADRPLLGSGALAQFARGHALDEALELLRRGGLHRQRVRSFPIAHYPLSVLLRRFFHSFIPNLAELMWRQPPRLSRPSEAGRTRHY